MNKLFSRVALMSLYFVISHIALAAGQTAADPGAGLFEKMCYSCHNIGGGDKKGPDLMGVITRRDRNWLHKYIPSPQAMKNSGDAATQQLFAKFAPEIMPDQVLSANQIDQILDLIQQLSASKRTFVPQGGRLSRQPTAADIPAGYQLFTGQVRLSKGGPPCISCHSVEGVGALGGGTLGPDLTQANVKYTDVELASILKSPAFPTMSKIFANHDMTQEEIVKLFAYLQSVKTRIPDPTRYGFDNIGFGAVGGLIVLMLINFTWRGRLHGVRKLLSSASRERKSEP